MGMDITARLTGSNSYLGMEQSRGFARGGPWSAAIIDARKAPQETPCFNVLMFMSLVMVCVICCILLICLCLLRRRTRLSPWGGQLGSRGGRSNSIRL